MSATAFDLKAFLDAKRSIVDLALQGLLPAADDFPRIVAAMRHSLFAGGKRLRPVLCLAAAEAVGSSGPSVVTAGCAVELIHTYSLIHDDLPAMDDDTLRRGKPTLHVAFDEATAILAGDALLTLAFEILAAMDPPPGVGAVGQLRIIGLIARAAGYQGMIEGQMRDMLAEHTGLTAEQLQALHRRKTGALIEASVVAGAILAGAPPLETEALRGYAESVGLAFQVTDDVLNVTGDPTLLGKAVGTDAERQKSTYPALLGIQNSKRFAQQLVDNALKCIINFDKRAQPLRELARYIVVRNR